MKPWLTFFACWANALAGFSQDGFIEGNPCLAFWQVGQQQETIIVLHGGPAAQHQYLRPEFDALQQNARVIFYDQRGCGKSQQANSYTWQDHVADLKRVIKRVAKNQKVFLAGSSWGSTLAIIYTYSHPSDIKGLILSGTYPWGGEANPYVRPKFMEHNPPHQQTFEEKRIRMKPLVNGEVAVDTITVSKTVELYSGLPLSEPRLSFISAPVADCLRQINVPILLFNGPLSQSFDWAETYVKLFPHVELHTLAGAGHDAWFSNPALFFSISNEFIRKNGR
jgi:pimeloyl-ACP methyl ester carboxylesterase